MKIFDFATKPLSAVTWLWIIMVSGFSISLYVSYQYMVYASSKFPKPGIYGGSKAEYNLYMDKAADWFYGGLIYAGVCIILLIYAYHQKRVEKRHKEILEAYEKGKNPPA